MCIFNRHSQQAFRACIRLFRFVWGTTLIGIAVFDAMGNSSARSRSNVKIKPVKIDLTMGERRQRPPVGAKFYGSNLAPFHEGPQPTVNMLAAQLAVDEKIRKSKLVDEKIRKSKLQEDFSSIFLQYHKACVQVICTTKEYGKTKGSGILFRVSETRLILVTAAHLIKNNNFKLELVIERKYQQLSREQVGAVKVYIKDILDIYWKDDVTDVAVIFLNNMDSAKIVKIVSKFPHPSFASTESASDTFMSIHYAKFEDRTDKQVSVGRAGFMRGDFLQLRPRLHIDGGPGASGAPLFNIEGDVVAILKSSQSDETRNFIRIEDIFKDDYHSRRAGLHDLHIIEKNEGLESRKLLNVLFQEKEKVNVSRRSMKYLIRSLEISQKLAHRYILRVVVFHCLGVGGAHGETSRWSLLKNVDSDHFPAVNAFEQASICKNRNVLPAITIPKIIHKKLATTVSRDFRSAQARNIRLGNTCEAIEANFDDYQEKGLFRQCNYICTDGDFKALLEEYRKGFKKALQLHVQLKFINEDQKQHLIDHIGRLIAYGQHDGEELEHKDKIAIMKMPPK